jgi:hypothetical protein
MPGEESEAAIVPQMSGTTGRREGPLLPSRERSEERPPDCARKGLPPSRSSVVRKTPHRMDKVRKLQRTLYRAAKQQPERRFSLLFDKVCRADILHEAWRRVAANNGSAGVDDADIAAVRMYGEARFLAEIQASLLASTYRAAAVRPTMGRRVRIPKPGQPGRTRPLGIPTVRDRVVQMAVKLVIEPMFEADLPSLLIRLPAETDPAHGADGDRRQHQ